MTPIQEKWPDQCPVCGCPAWFGPMSVKCVNAKCENGSAAEAEEYQSMLSGPSPASLIEGARASGILDDLMEVDEDADTEPSIMKFFQDLDNALEMRLNSFGYYHSERMEDRDAMKFMLFSRNSRLEVSETMTVMDAMDFAGMGVKAHADRIAYSLVNEMLRRVTRSAENLDDFLEDALRGLREGWVYMPSGGAKYFGLGQYFGVHRITGIDRHEDKIYVVSL